MDNINSMLGKLGQELVNSTFLSVMIVNKKHQVVWHNQRFAEEFAHGRELRGMPCFETIGSTKVHNPCPLHQSIVSGESSKGFLDFGDQFFLYLTIPLNDEHAAKVHIFLPKQAE